MPGPQLEDEGASGPWTNRTSPFLDELPVDAARTPRRRQRARVARRFVITPSSFCPSFFATASILYCIFWGRPPTVAGGQPDGVRRKAAAVPGMLSLPELRFWAQIRRGPARRPYGRLALCRAFASVFTPLTQIAEEVRRELQELSAGASGRVLIAPGRPRPAAALRTPCVPPEPAPARRQLQRARCASGALLRRGDATPKAPWPKSRLDWSRC